MGPSQSLILSLTLAIFLTLTSSDYGNFVFKGCTNQNQDSNAFHKQTIKHLLDTLTVQSSVEKFNNITFGDGGASAVYSLFQCRGDLSNGDCKICVKKASAIAQKLCKEAVTVRIQLKGCYLRYEDSEFRLAGGTDILYKSCGSNWPGFEDTLDIVLGKIVKGLESGDSGGFYVGVYQSVYALGQCEGGLSGGDCVNCVKNAIDEAKSECGSSISAQIYLQGCFITYTYYPNGVPSNQNTSSGKWLNKKKIAIMLGVVGLLGLLAVFLLYAKDAFKKETYTYKF